MRTAHCGGLVREIAFFYWIDIYHTGSERKSDVPVNVSLNKFKNVLTFHPFLSISYWQRAVVCSTFPIIFSIFVFFLFVVMKTICFHTSSNTNPLRPLHAFHLMYSKLILFSIRLPFHGWISSWVNGIVFDANFAIYMHHPQKKITNEKCNNSTVL